MPVLPINFLKLCTWQKMLLVVALAEAISGSTAIRLGLCDEQLQLANKTVSSCIQQQHEHPAAGPERSCKAEVEVRDYADAARERARSLPERLSSPGDACDQRCSVWGCCHVEQHAQECTSRGEGSLLGLAGDL